jgi:hypothetical protein
MEKIIKDICASILYFMTGVVGVLCVLVLFFIVGLYFLFFIWIIDALLYKMFGDWVLFKALMKGLAYFNEGTK